MTDESTRREGFDADELGKQSIYEGETEMQRRMRRGDETEGDPDARDVAGATDVKDTDEARRDRDTPHHDAGEPRT